MNYQLSANLLKSVKTAKNILVNTHKNPDYDSIASALSLQYVLKTLGKNVKIVSCQKINEHFFFLEGAEEINFINFKSFKNFINYDLFIIPDTGNFDRVTGSKEIALPEAIDYIVIDHHKTNSFSHPLKLIDEQAGSTTEVLYSLFSDWNIKIDQNLATLLLTGILGDTVFLRYCENRKKTMKAVTDLINNGADMDFISENFYERYDFSYIKLVGEFLARMQKEKGFVWSAVDYKTYKKYSFEGAREMVADLFFRGISETDFGVVLLESKKGLIILSFRSKKNTDVTKFAKLFGGGGHKNAAGATVHGNIDQIIKKIKEVIDRI